MHAALLWLCVVLLTAAGVVSVAHAVADETVADINGKLFELGREHAGTGLAVSEPVVKQLEANARAALKWAPQNGQYLEALARVQYLPRMTSNGVVVSDIDGAYQTARSAVVAQPSSAYAWGSLAFASDRLMAESRLPGGQAALERAILRAATLGAYEPYVLRGVIDIGLANWITLSADAKRSVMQSVRHLALRQADDVIALAKNRGRLSVVCAEKRLVGRKECTISANVNQTSS